MGWKLGWSSHYVCLMFVRRVANQHFSLGRGAAAPTLRGISAILSYDSSMNRNRGKHGDRIQHTGPRDRDRPRAAIQSPARTDRVSGTVFSA